MTFSLQEVWEEVPSDPDPTSDLGYEYRPLSLITVEEGGEKYVCLPREEDHLTDEEFFVVDGGGVRELENCR